MNLNHRTSRHRQPEGSAVIVVMAILALLLMYSAANLITLNVLDAELELLDDRQQRRIRQGASPTPSVHPIILPSSEEELAEGSD